MKLDTDNKGEIILKMGMKHQHKHQLGYDTNKIVTNNSTSDSKMPSPELISLQRRVSNLDMYNEMVVIARS